MADPLILLAREAVKLGSDRELRRAASAGRVVRIQPGAFVAATDWASATDAERYRARVRAAAARSHAYAQFSHASAAAMYRLPAVGAWPKVVHELVAASAGGTSRTVIRRHGLGFDEHPRLIDSVLVTSFARTLVDVSATEAFASAVIRLDDSMRAPREHEPRFGMGVPALTRAELLSELASLEPYRGSVKSRLAIEFADGGAGSPGESLCRVQFRALGVVPPLLQHEFRGAGGFSAFTDFWWPEVRIAGEYDGPVKYSRNRAFQRDTDAREILWEEKVREDTIRRQVAGFFRLTADDIRDRQRLRRVLLDAGVPFM